MTIGARDVPARPRHLTIVSLCRTNVVGRESPVSRGFQGLNASRRVSQESSRAANSSLPRRGFGTRTSLPCRADGLGLGDADPAKRTAGAGPETGLAVPALARAQGDESRAIRSSNYMKCMMEQKNFFFDEEAFRAPREAAGDAARGAARAGAEGIRPVRAEPGRLGRPARQSRLADPAEAEDRRVRPSAPGGTADARHWPGPSRCGSGPKSPRHASTTRSEPPRPCSPSRDTWASIRRSLATWWVWRSRRVAIEPLEEMLEQPGCPNLYWALTNLPSPLISSTRVWKASGSIAPVAIFRDLNDSAPMSADQLQRFHRVHGQAARGRAAHQARRAGVAGRADQGREEVARRPPPPRRVWLPGGAAERASRPIR